MEIAMKSHVGYVRPVNEDFFACVADVAGRVLAVVADGMGGHQAGDVASRMAVERIVAELRHVDGGLSTADVREKLLHAVRMANEEVFRYAADHPECSGMGTTVVATLLGPEGGVTAHIGDSRLYLYRAGVLTQETVDHSLVQELVRSGQITVQEASFHPQRNVLIRALGTESDVQVDLSEFSWSTGDVVLLCSDGLSNKVPEEVMKRCLQDSRPLQEQVDELVQHALDAGGEDNITLVAVRNTLIPNDPIREER